jgi:hypothetical protein
VSYDKNERLYRPPLPLLFQNRRRLKDRPVTESVLPAYLDYAPAAAGITYRGHNPCATPSNNSGG